MVPPFLSRTQKFLKQHSNLKQSFICFPPSLLNCSEFLNFFLNIQPIPKQRKIESVADPDLELRGGGRKGGGEGGRRGGERS